VTEVVPVEQLAPAEAGRLAELEAVVAAGLQTFVEVGLALTEIRDGRLYRATHGTFEGYLDERWGFSRSYGYRLIDGARVAELVSPMGDIPNERQARELVPLLDRPDDLVEVVLELRAEHGDRFTAAKLRQAVDERLRRDHVLDVMGSSASDDWETPQDLFDDLDREFGFELDVCANDANTKCARYFSPVEDGLAQEWRGVCWMNPPYGDEIPRWARKAYESSLLGAVVVCLVPARVDTAWWWDYCLTGEIRFLRGRLRFGASEAGAPFPSAVVVLEQGREHRVVWWGMRSGK
jgi:phage N-6-adenine-methyltransferase